MNLATLQNWAAEGGENQTKLVLRKDVILLYILLYIFPEIVFQLF